MNAVTPPEDLERVLANLALEIARRNEELRAAYDRRAAAEARLQVQQTEARRELTELTAAAEAEIARMEAAHRRAVDAITAGVT